MPSNILPSNTLPQTPPAARRVPGSTSRLEGRAELDPRLPGPSLPRRVDRLGFRALALLVRDLLLRMGYTDIALRRTRWKGRNSDGGWDLEATLEAGGTCQRVLVQVKRLAHPVQARSVDELRGAVLRAGAAQGLLVATGAISPVAMEAAKRAQSTPVTLIDGERLAHLLCEYGINEHGVEPPAEAARPPFPQTVPPSGGAGSGGAGPFCDCPPEGIPPSVPGVSVTITVNGGPLARPAAPESGSDSNDFPNHFPNHFPNDFSNNFSDEFPDAHAFRPSNPFE